MFRCITDIKGLVFDLNSFRDIGAIMISEMFSDYRLLFMTSEDELALIVSENLGDDALLQVERFQMLFAPNQGTHLEVLKQMRLEASEVLYVSMNKNFLDNASCFMGGTVWIEQEIDYRDVSQAPDLICRDLTNFQTALQQNAGGFFGEVQFDPLRTNMRGNIVPVSFPTNEGCVLLYMLGRYFGYSQYMSQLHPYSSAIYLNKQNGKPYYGVFNDRFLYIIYRAVQEIKRKYVVDAICCVPPRPNHESRFHDILDRVAEKCDIQNICESLVCVRDYPSQKGLSAVDREKNVDGAFAITTDINRKNIIILDDVISTGSTIKECIHVLKKNGASKVYALALAINQPSWNYWSSSPIQVSCPKCGRKMRLLANGKNASFFYACYDCHKTENYAEGRKQVIVGTNSEFTY